MRYLQTRVAVAVAALGILAIAGCAPKKEAASGGAAAPAASTSATPAPAAQTTVTYAIIPKMLNNPVFPLAKLGAQKAARDLEAANPGTKYEIIFQSSQTGKANEQADTITTIAGKKVDGMSISVIDANAVKGPINDAVDKGIPVMCFDSDAPDTKRVSFYAVNDEAIGKELGNQLIAAVGKDKMTGEVAILSGQSSAPNLQDRVKGVESALDAKDFPGVKILPILYCDDNLDKSVELIRTTMQAHPKLTGFVFVGGWPLFVKNALDKVDPKITKVVSVDTLPAERDYLKAGQVACLIGQKYFGWGEESVKTLEGIRTGKNKTPPAFIDSGYDLIFNTPTDDQRKLAHDNVRVFSAAEYDKLWDEWNKEN
jgi:ribose transport system substrate-binding protein